jgi:SH3-like domain-containing protein
MAAPRTRIVLAVLLPAALAILSSAAQAVDFRSVLPGPAVMYDAPGLKSKKVFIAPAGMPLELVLTNGDWSRVRDAGGDLAWIENKYLSNRRTLVVDVPQATARASASDTASVVFSAAKGVLLELAEPVSSGWLKVKHRDGESGYVKASDVWGE